MPSVSNQSRTSSGTLRSAADEASGCACGGELVDDGVTASFVTAGDRNRGAVLGEQFSRLSTTQTWTAGDEDVLAN